MKLLLAVVLSTFAFSSFAAITKLSCTVAETTFDVNVAGEFEPSSETESVFTDLHDRTGTVIISSRYNGISTRMKPGASGNYTLNIYIKMQAGNNPAIVNNAGSLNFSANFPNSQTILMSRDTGNEDEELENFFTIPVTCKAKNN